MAVDDVGRLMWRQDDISCVQFNWVSGLVRLSRISSFYLRHWLHIVDGHGQVCYILLTGMGRCVSYC